jgi:5-methylcytosine-specific restriction endonuclease McrA
MRKACVICGRPHGNRGARCELHAIPARTGTYSRNAALVRATATVCHLCGQPFTADDPAVADHVVPRGVGGSDDLTNLRAAHRSCNGRKGAELGNIGGLYPGGRVAT